MSWVRRLAAAWGLQLGVCGLLFGITGCSSDVMLLAPAGPVARIEAHLILITIVLTAVVVLPVMALLWYIVHTYRDVPDNPAEYKPEWSESKTLEFVWWLVPIVIIGILGTFTARDTFALTRPPEHAAARLLTIDVTSLNWKWLFQYPGQNIATVNSCTIPTGQAVQFVLTANAPMNSFWVPQLGGQEYTMPGMAMRLWLEADRPGLFYGHGANFTGSGFAHMNFHVHAVSPGSFDQWAKRVKRTAPALTEVGYRALSQPGLAGQLQFSSYPSGSFEKLVMQDGGMYMARNRGVRDTSKS